MIISKLIKSSLQGLLIFALITVSLMKDIKEDKNMDLPKMIAVMRCKYHLEMIDLVNAGHQLHLISGGTADQKNRKHLRTLINDILPRLGYDTSEYQF